MVKFFFSSNIYTMRFSEWLKTNRKAAKLSQDKLAERINELGKSFGFSITSAQISNYEREYDKDQDGNPTRPKEKFVELAAQVLSRPIDEAKIAANYAPGSDSAAVPKPILEALAREGSLSSNDEQLIADFIIRLKQTQ